VKKGRQEVRGERGGKEFGQGKTGGRVANPIKKAQEVRTARRKKKKTLAMTEMKDRVDNRGKDKYPDYKTAFFFMKL